VSRRASAKSDHPGGGALDLTCSSILDVDSAGHVTIALDHANARDAFVVRLLNSERW
jgi:hypothetical protein